MNGQQKTSILGEGACPKTKVTWPLNSPTPSGCCDTSEGTLCPQGGLATRWHLDPEGRRAARPAEGPPPPSFLLTTEGLQGEGVFQNRRGMCFLNLCFCLIRFGIHLPAAEVAQCGLGGLLLLSLVPPPPTVLSQRPSEDISWSHDQAWEAKGNWPGLTLAIT